jgi:hypothetical protein
VAVAIDNTVVDAVALVSAMLPAPNAIARVLALFELKMPVDSVNPLSVIVPVVSVNVPAAVQSVAVPDNDKLMSALSTVVLRETAVDATVTVAAVPEFASNVTVSAFVGADAPLPPPEVADQFVVEVLFQVPEPPTQKRAAIYPSRMSGGISSSAGAVTTVSQLVRRSCFMLSTSASVRVWSSGKYKASENGPNSVSKVNRICMDATRTRGIAPLAF